MLGKATAVIRNESIVPKLMSKGDNAAIMLKGGVVIVNGNDREPLANVQLIWSLRSAATISVLKSLDWFKRT